jgi:hypothetical protein
MEAQAWKAGGCLTAPRKRIGESKGIRPGTMISTTSGDYRRQRGRGGTSLSDPDERPERKIGAAAVVDLEDQHAHSQMGDDSTSTVYAAEL